MIAPSARPTWTRCGSASVCAEVDDVLDVLAEELARRDEEIADLRRERDASQGLHADPSDG